KKKNRKAAFDSESCKQLQEIFNNNNICSFHSLLEDRVGAADNKIFFSETPSKKGDLSVSSVKGTVKNAACAANVTVQKANSFYTKHFSLFAKQFKNGFLKDGIYHKLDSDKKNKLPPIIASFVKKHPKY